MARKTTEKSPTTRSKKAATTVPPVTEQVAAPIQKEVSKIVAQQPRAEGRKNGKSANVATAKVPAASAPAAIEEQIRRRAYELYLERRATAGMADGLGYGDENQDWLIAEREIRSRQEDQGHHSA